MHSNIRLVARKRGKQAGADSRQSDRLEDIIYELIVKSSHWRSRLRRPSALELDHERQELYLDVLVAQIKANKSDLTAAEVDLKRSSRSWRPIIRNGMWLERENQEIKVKRQEVNQNRLTIRPVFLELTRLISDLERTDDLASWNLSWRLAVS